MRHYHYFKKVATSTSFCCSSWWMLPEMWYLKKGFLVTHYGITLVYFLGGFPLDPVPFDLHSFWIWTFLSHLWQVIFDPADEPPLESLTFTLWWLLKPTCFNALLANWSMSTVYSFGSKGCSWDFSLLLIHSHRFELIRSRYSRIAYFTRDS